MKRPKREIARSEIIEFGDGIVRTIHGEMRNRTITIVEDDIRDSYPAQMPRPTAESLGSAAVDREVTIAAYGVMEQYSIADQEQRVRSEGVAIHAGADSPAAQRIRDDYFSSLGMRQVGS